MAEIRFEKLTKEFKETVAVDHLDLVVEEGQFFSLLGPSGCGKTTTLRMIGGFEDPTEGAIYLGGDDVTDLPAYKRNVNTVFQSYALFPHLDVFNNVAYGLKRKKVAQEDIKQRVEDMLSLVDLEGYGPRRINQMSGGQQQRVALARGPGEPSGRATSRRTTRRLGPQAEKADATGVQAHPARGRNHLHLRDARSGRGDDDVRSHRRDARRKLRTGGRAAGRLRIARHRVRRRVPRGLEPAGRRGRRRRRELAKVALAAGSTIALPAARLPTQRGAVRIGVRPEKIFIEPADKGSQDQGDNSIEAVVDISTYTGVSTSYECSTTDGAKVVVYVQNMAASSEALGPGTDVRLSWHPEHTFAVKRSTSTEPGGPE